jgi:hypothetical protein
MPDADRTIWALAFYDVILAAGWTGLDYEQFKPDPSPVG